MWAFCFEIEFLFSFFFFFSVSCDFENWLIRLCCFYICLRWVVLLESRGILWESPSKMLRVKRELIHTFQPDVGISSSTVCHSSIWRPCVTSGTSNITSQPWRGALFFCLPIGGIKISLALHRILKTIGREHFLSSIGRKTKLPCSLGWHCLYLPKLYKHPWKDCSGQKLSLPQRKKHAEMRALWRVVSNTWNVIFF